MNKKLKRGILLSQGVRCWYCGFNSYREEWEFEHQTPLSRGGTDDPENIVVSCKECNRRKKTRTLEEYPHFIRDYADAQLFAASVNLLPFSSKGDKAALEAQVLIERAREILMERFNPDFPGEVRRAASGVIEIEGATA